ncbi:GNAT family N-acetyltransferase [Actinoplanes sp. NPDC051861]|uniref:GNAT family N-acetyltransferase n=1 Tax=Actinoplanes sp. NPDC051861 TaxID=3155170 RepID=UPI00342DB506
MSFSVVDVPERERFEARDPEGVVAGVVTYQLTGNIVVYTHSSFEESAVGAVLARAVMDDARAKGRTVVPMCPLLSDWLDKHPEYEKLVARTTRRVR